MPTGPFPERRTILAIDPGTTESGFVLWDGSVLAFGMMENQSIVNTMRNAQRWNPDIVAIEMVACYGMAVGKEVFETCLWIGRMIERSPAPHHLIYRRDVKIHLCGTAKAKDGNVRMALLDRFGGKEKAVGKKSNPGPLYGISGHLWSALAVADYAASLNL